MGRDASPGVIARSSEDAGVPQELERLANSWVTGIGTNGTLVEGEVVYATARLAMGHVGRAELPDR